MKFIADFHIHSHYSIATSKDLVPEQLDYWARLKGIKVVGTGDFTHPGWQAELKDKLEPAEAGLFKLKSDLCRESPAGQDDEVRFMLTAEISSIYKKQGRVRKVHNVIFAPDFETVDKISATLGELGNLRSDGRPILGLDSRDLLEIALSANENIFFLPAHIWTPWFSVLGAKSGFDSIEECFEDLSGHIYAVETGLSSDPPMNWLCRRLDRFTLLSNSDAHSPQKLGRNANIFNTELSYREIIEAITSARADRFLGTIDLFPQEGKYHFAGHRKCGTCWDPVQTLRHRGLCPVCGKKVTEGVMERVVRLSDRTRPGERPRAMPFHHIIPLKEILSEISNVGPASQKVDQAYKTLLQKCGSEFNVLLNWPLTDLEEVTNDVTVEAVRRMREGRVIIKEGFDGQYGQISLFDEQERRSLTVQENLFNKLVAEERPAYRTRRLLNFDMEEYRRLRTVAEAEAATSDEQPQPEEDSSGNRLTTGLNPGQQEAVTHFRGAALVIAGPGTGKTRVLTTRIAGLIAEQHVEPEHILAVTFTRKAAGEIEQRLSKLVARRRGQGRPMVSTFHAFGFGLLNAQAGRLQRRQPFLLLDERDRLELLRGHMGLDSGQTKKLAGQFTSIKQQLLQPDEIEDQQLARNFQFYETLLQKFNAFDLDDLIYQTVRLFRDDAELLMDYRNRHQWLLVDEYQDINYAQYYLVRQLMPSALSNLMVIGDPDQSIYGFRGSDRAFINRFLDDYQGAKVYRLKTSYRCSETILKASAGVILEQSGRAPFLSGLQKGAKLNISEHLTDKSEAEHIARTIEQALGGVRFFSMDSSVSSGRQTLEVNGLADFAILVRIARQIPVIQKALDDHSLPCQVAGRNPWEDEPLLRSVCDLLRLLLQPGHPFLQERFENQQAIQKSALSYFKGLVPGKMAVEEIISLLFDKFLTDKTRAAGSLNDLALRMAAGCGSNVETFLRNIQLSSELDGVDFQAGRVTVMTLHAAKGLEFECVFIPGVEAGLIPFDLPGAHAADVEEERRLLYVGMTRARKYLFLSHAGKRFLMGREHILPPSPFLQRIGKELTEQEASRYKRPVRKDDGQLSLFD